MSTGKILTPRKGIVDPRTNKPIPGSSDGIGSVGDAILQCAQGGPPVPITDGSGRTVAAVISPVDLAILNALRTTIYDVAARLAASMTPTVRGNDPAGSGEAGTRATDLSGSAEGAECGP